MGFSKPPGVPCPPRNPHCNGNAPDVPLDNPYFIYGIMIIAILFIAYKMGLFNNISFNFNKSKNWESRNN